MKNFFNSLGGIIFVGILLIVAVVVGMVQLEYLYFALILDVIFMIAMSNVDKNLFVGNRRSKAVIVAAVALMLLIPTSLVFPINIFIFIFIVIPIISFGVIRRRKRNIN